MRKSTIFLLVAALLLSLAGCSTETAKPTESAPTVQETEETPTPAPTAAPTAEPTEIPTEPPTQAPTEPPTKILWLMTRRESSGTTNQLETWDYDTQGRLIFEYLDFLNGHGHGYRYTYDDRDNVIRKEYHETGTLSDYNLYTYDDAGNMLTCDNYSTSGVLRSNRTYAYDKNSNLVKETFSVPGNSYLNITEYTYDSQGNILTQHAYTTDPGSKYDNLQVNTYDASGKMLSSLSYSSGELNTESLWTYDEAGRLLHKTISICYGAEKEVREELRYTYDDKGNVLTTYENYGGDDRRAMRSECTYDEAGNLLTEQFYMGEQYLGLREYTYDSNGIRLTAKHTTPDGNHTLTEFDSQGNVTNVTSSNGNIGAQNTYESIYDDAGNLLSFIMYAADGSIIDKTEYTYIAIEVPNK